MSVAGPYSKFKNIEGLIVYVSPDTTDPKIIELKNFILSQTGKELKLNNGIKINVPIVETTFPPMVNRPKRGSTNLQITSTGEYEIDLDQNFCNNSISKMGTAYAIKEEPNYITLFAITKDYLEDVVAFLTTISIKTDISGETKDYSLWVDALCSDQVNEFKGGSALLRLVFALCKKFNRNLSKTFRFVNIYLEALYGVEQTYLKLGFNESYDINPVYFDGSIFKKPISETKSNESSVTDEKSISSPVADEKSMESNFVNAELGNEEEENKLLDGLDSGKITWVTGNKSLKTRKKRKMKKKKPRKSRRARRSRR